MLISQFISRSEQEAPLVVFVHGRAGNIKVMDAFKNVIPKDVSILAVQAPLKDPEGGFRWWHFDKATHHTADIQESAIRAADDFIVWLTNFLIEENLKPRQVLALGFSQGAALLSCAIQKNHHLFAGVALLAGFVIMLPKDPQHSTDDGNLTKVLISHGTKDDIVPLSKAKEGAEYLTQRGFEVDFVTDEVSHKIGVLGMKTLKAWVNQRLKLTLSPQD